jgi:hypothetical protein
MFRIGIVEDGCSGEGEGEGEGGGGGDDEMDDVGEGLVVKWWWRLVTGEPSKSGCEPLTPMLQRCRSQAKADVE